MKSVSMPWTRYFFNRNCPCGSGEKSFGCCWRDGGCWEKEPLGVITVPIGNETTINSRCYMSPLRNCSAKITKEHFVSRTILERLTNDTLTFENAGHFFGGRQKVKIGIDGFSSKVLCDRHNSALSILDSRAGVAFSTIEELSKDLIELTKGANGIKSFHISSGLDIERWMIKVYCGLLTAGKIRGRSGKALERTDLQSCLLHSLLGTESLVEPLGLYMHSFAGQQRMMQGLSFGTVQLTDGSDGVGGLMLSLGPINLVLIVSDQFGKTFSENNWYRHQGLAWKVRQNGSRVDYLFTY